MLSAGTCRYSIGVSVSCGSSYCIHETLCSSSGSEGFPLTASCRPIGSGIEGAVSAHTSISPSSTLFDTEPLRFPKFVPFDKIFELATVMRSILVIILSQVPLGATDAGFDTASGARENGKLRCERGGFTAASLCRRRRGGGVSALCIATGTLNSIGNNWLSPCTGCRRVSSIVVGAAVIDAVRTRLARGTGSRDGSIDGGLFLVGRGRGEGVAGTGARDAKLCRLGLGELSGVGGNVAGGYSFR